MGEGESLLGPGVEGRLGGRGEDSGRVATLAAAGGEVVEGVECTGGGHLLLWTSTGAIHLVDLSGGRWRRVGRLGRVAFLSLQGCGAGRALVCLAGARSRLLLVDTEGAVCWRLVEEGVLRGAALGEGVVAVWGESGAAVWRVGGATSLLARLAVAAPLVGAAVVEVEGEQAVVLVTRDGRVAAWSVAGAPVLRGAVEVGGRVSALHSSPTTLFLATSKGVVGLHLATLTPTLIIPLALPTVSNLVVHPTSHLALLHTATSVLLLSPSSAPLHLATPGEGCSSTDLSMVARLHRGKVSVYRVAESFTPLPPKPDPPSLPRAPNLPEGQGASKPTPKASQPKPHSAKPALKTSQPEASSKQPAATKSSAERSAEVLERVDVEELLGLVRGTGLGLPPAARPALWAHLLGLPRDGARYHRLAASLPSPTTMEVLLAVWPHLRPLPHLPLLLRPLLATYPDHPTTRFEAAAAAVHLYLPQPPEPVLEAASTILALEQPALGAHLATIGATSRQLYWPLLATGWATLLEGAAWAALWDHLLLAGPALLAPLLAATAASLPALASCSSPWAVGRLLASWPALALPALLTTAHAYLGRHRALAEQAVPHKEGLFQGGGYPTLGGRRRELRDGVKGRGENGGRSRGELGEVDGRRREVLGEVDTNCEARVARALAISPPPVPRVASRLQERGEHLDPSDPLAPLAPLAPSYLLPGQADMDQELEALLTKARLGR